MGVRLRHGAAHALPHAPAVQRGGEGHRSLAVGTIAARFELARKPQLVPFATAAAASLARATLGADGSVFDHDRVPGGLFKVRYWPGKERPACAAVAVCCKDGWFYIARDDHETRATFALLLHLSRLELGRKAGGAPVLTLPLGGR